MKRILFLLFLLFVPFVSAGLEVSPSNSQISTYWYQPSIQNISIWNNNSFIVKNLTFSPVNFFTFPTSVDLNPNETKVIQYSVTTNELFSSRAFISTLSFFYVVPVPPSPTTVDVNISIGGFSSAPTIMSNDSVRWFNNMNVAVELRDLSTGFPVVNIPANGFVNSTYLTVKNFSFYNVQSGVVSSLSVIPRSGISLGHDSSLDKDLIFSVASLLPPSTMEVNLLSSNISVRNNETYQQALIQIRNTDPNLVIQGVNISADRWANNFTPLTFNLNPNGVQNVLFNITPLVDKTNLTNRTNKITLTVKSLNAGQTIKQIDVFIPYQNFDVVNVGGVNYTITFLGINETATACSQNRLGVGLYKAGFEACKQLEVVNNVTIIREIEAQYKLSQTQIDSLSDSNSLHGQVATRLENKMNLYVDKQDGVNLAVNNLTTTMTAFEQYILQTESERNDRVDRYNVRFWIFFSLVLLFFIFSMLVGMLEEIDYMEKMEKGGQ